jgi:hypothetical protein
VDHRSLGGGGQPSLHEQKAGLITYRRGHVAIVKQKKRRRS